MGQPVKLSDELILDARLTGQDSARSIAGQVEFWARIGRAIEPLLTVRQAKNLAQQRPRTPLAECVKIIGTEAGEAQLTHHLESRPYPHYEQAPHDPGLLVR